MTSPRLGGSQPVSAQRDSLSAENVTVIRAKGNSFWNTRRQRFLQVSAGGLDSRHQIGHPGAVLGDAARRGHQHLRPGFAEPAAHLFRRGSLGPVSRGQQGRSPGGETDAVLTGQRCCGGSDHQPDVSQTGSLSPTAS